MAIHDYLIYLIEKSDIKDLETIISEPKIEAEVKKFKTIVLGSKSDWERSKKVITPKKVKKSNHYVNIYESLAINEELSE